MVHASASERFAIISHMSGVNTAVSLTSHVSIYIMNGSRSDRHSRLREAYKLHEREN
jgi:hypothetical protein